MMLYFVLKCCVCNNKNACGITPDKLRHKGWPNSTIVLKIKKCHVNTKCNAHHVSLQYSSVLDFKICQFVVKVTYLILFLPILFFLSIVGWKKTVSKLGFGHYLGGFCSVLYPDRRRQFFMQ